MIIDYRLQFKYCDTWGPVHGSTDYPRQDVILQDGEFIKRLAGYKGFLFGTVRFFTTSGRDLGEYGSVNTPRDRYKDPDKSMFTFLEGKFCMSYGYGDRKNRFCDVKLNYLYRNKKKH